MRIIVSGYTDSEDIIAGINEAGIFQYLLKPWQPESLLTLRNAAQLQRLQAEKSASAWTSRCRAGAAPARRRQARGGARPPARGALLRAPDSPMNAICALVDKVAGYDIPVLLTGESGTGKELLRAPCTTAARASRRLRGGELRRAARHPARVRTLRPRRGAYTGATEDREGLFRQASGGSILLDEIGETSAAFQVKLLRVLQEGEVRPVGAPRPVAVDVRVIAATNRDLEEEVRAGRFREDLYYRLAASPCTCRRCASGRWTSP